MVESFARDAARRGGLGAVVDRRREAEMSRMSISCSRWRGLGGRARGSQIAALGLTVERVSGQTRAIVSWWGALAAVSAVDGRECSYIRRRGRAERPFVGASAKWTLKRSLEAALHAKGSCNSQRPSPASHSSPPTRSGARCSTSSASPPPRCARRFPPKAGLRRTYRRR